METAAARAERYHNKAEEVRILAERMKSPEARQIFIRIAADYLEMALAMERMAAGDTRRS